MQSSGSDLEHLSKTSNCPFPLSDLICNAPSLEKGVFSVAILSAQCSERTGEK
jgi:hypothetical protein